MHGGDGLKRLRLFGGGRSHSGNKEILSPGFCILGQTWSSSNSGNDENVVGSAKKS